MSDQEIQNLENEFPAMSGRAFSAARKRVLASGQAVMQAENGFLVREFPDGRKETVKAMRPLLKVRAGTVLPIR